MIMLSKAQLVIDLFI